jgi:hypothetical protein
MRSPILLPSFAIPFLLAASLGTAVTLDPTPHLHDVDKSIKSLNLGSRERQAIFGDTSESASMSTGRRAELAAIIKRLRVTDCHAGLSSQLESQCTGSKDGEDLGEAFRSEGRSLTSHLARKRRLIVQSPSRSPFVRSLPPCRLSHQTVRLGPAPVSRLLGTIVLAGECGDEIQRAPRLELPA